MGTKWRPYNGLVLLMAVCCVMSACTKKMPEVVTPIDGVDENGGYRPVVPDVSGQLKAAGEKNSDTVGWLMIPNTAVNDVVVQTTDNDFYLRRDAEKKYAYEGCYYMDYESVLLDNGADLPANTIIYGHNLGKPMGVKDDPEGVRFAQLLKFDDEAVAKNTPYIYLTTGGATHIFQIFAAYYCEAFTKPVPYHHAEYTPEEVEALASDAKARSKFLYDVPVTGTDKLLTLSTCSYRFGTYSENPDQRYVVMARKVQEGESFAKEAPIQLNPSVKEPVFS